MAIDTSGWQVLLVSLIATHVQTSIIYHTFFPPSLTTDMNRVSQDPLVPSSCTESNVSNFRVRDPLFFLLLVVRVAQCLFVSRKWLLWKKVIEGKCGSSFVYKASSTVVSSELLYSVALSELYSIFLTCRKDDHIAGLLAGRLLQRTKGSVGVALTLLFQVVKITAK